MNKTTHTSYDDVPYESMPYFQSSPANIRTVGVLFGMNPPAIENARILELGCAAGGNLIPIAMNYPKSDCIGIDLSSVQIEQGRSAVKTLGIKNIKLEALSIMDVDSSLGKFDYIITHGVFSWVPEAVRDKIFEICKTMLTDNGIAYISYNTLPGWNMVRTIREMMQYHSSGFQEGDKVTQARLLLEFIKDSTEGQHTPYADFLRSEAATLANLNDSYIRHEHLAENNIQLYFSDFIAQAHKHDLQYLGDAFVASMFIGNLPPKARDKLAEIPDIVRVEQYLDFLNNRRFRSTLLAKNTVKINRALNSNDIDKFYVSLKMTAEKPESEANFEDTTESVKFFLSDNKDVNIATTSKFMKAILYTLSENSHKLLTPTEVATLSAAKIKSSDVDAIKNEFIANALKLVLSGFMKISSEAATYITEANKTPKVSSLVRYQCENTQNLWVTNQKNEVVSIDIFDKIALRYLDGKNNKDKILDNIIQHMEKNGITISKNDVKIEDPAAARAEVSLALDNLLLKLEKCALLV